DQAAWDKLVSRFYYVAGSFTEMKTFELLKTEAKRLDAEYGCEGNKLFYFAVAPRLFGTLCDNLHASSFKDGAGWKRIIVEKPFGTSLESALQLNREVLANWSEDQIYRIDHYLGKETVQNLLAFRFSNGIWEPLWNNKYIDNIQFNVSEAVDVEGRGGYYHSSGLLRDRRQDQVLQMRRHLGGQSPGSCSTRPSRNEQM